MLALLEAGGDIAAKDRDGKTPEQLAEIGKHDVAKQTLRRFVRDKGGTARPAAATQPGQDVPIGIAPGVHGVPQRPKVTPPVMPRQASTGLGGSVSPPDGDDRWSVDMPAYDVIGLKLKPILMPRVRRGILRPAVRV